MVGPRAGTTGLQVGPSLARCTVLIMGDLTLKEKGRKWLKWDQGSSRKRKSDSAGPSLDPCRRHLA